MTKVLLARPPDELLPPEVRLGLLDEIASARGFGLAVANRGTYLEVGRALHAMGSEATFVIGSDKLAQLQDPSFYADAERGVEATFAELRFLVVPRPGAEIDRTDIRLLDPADVFTDPAETAISSTEVRRRIRAGDDVDAFVPPEVARGLGGYTAAR
jgi:nicotinic acid mononucleotide adenylyltransferase